MTLGLVALFGGSLTVGAIAMLPVLVGLAVDYAIQFQARFNEARAEGGARPGGRRLAAARRRPGDRRRLPRDVAGFAVFALSPSPLVRSFGLLLVIGVGARLPRRPHRRPRRARPGRLAPANAARRAPRPRGERRAGRRPARLRSIGVAAIALALASPGGCSRPGLLLAVCGWVAGAGTGVETDIRDLAPPHLAALKDLNELEEQTGISGDVNVTIKAPTTRPDPAVIDWARGLPAAGAGAPRLPRRPELRQTPRSARRCRSPTSSAGGRAGELERPGAPATSTPWSSRCPASSPRS